MTEPVKWEEWKRKVSLFFAGTEFYDRVPAGLWVDLVRACFDAGMTLRDATEFIGRWFTLMDTLVSKEARGLMRVHLMHPHRN